MSCRSLYVIRILFNPKAVLNTSDTLTGKISNVIERNDEVLFEAMEPDEEEPEEDDPETEETKEAPGDKNGWLRIKCPESRTGYAYVSNEEGQYAFVGKGLYTVAARDNLWKIAEKQLGNGARYTEIRQLNGLTCNIIRVGMPLILPEK